jgi:virginiamycin B lyase
MFVPLCRHQRIAGLTFTPFASDRRRARRHPPERTRSQARLQLEGLEDRSLLSGISGYTEYSLPTASAEPTAIVAGPDGNLWFLENVANKIGMANPTTRTITEFPIPTAGSNPWGIASGPDGNVWFTERSGNKVAMINVNTHTISEFTMPSGSGLADPIGIAAGPDGNVWFAGYGPNGLGMINPTTRSITGYPKPSTWGNAAMWITAGPDGNLWFTELGVGQVARFDPTSHAEAAFQTTAASLPDPSTSRRAPTGTSGTPTGALTRS